VRARAGAPRPQRAGPAGAICGTRGGRAGLIQAVRAAVRPEVPLHVLVRPRGGDFLYSAAERQVRRPARRAPGACGEPACGAASNAPARAARACAANGAACLRCTRKATARAQVMAADVEAAAALGAAGVALGLLTADGEVDAPRLAPLVALCRSRVRAARPRCAAAPPPG